MALAGRALPGCTLRWASFSERSEACVKQVIVVVRWGGDRLRVELCEAQIRLALPSSNYVDDGELPQ
jgi:hypothetical protein